MLNLIILLTVSLSLSKAESLAVKNSPEMVSMYQNMMSLQDEYKSLIYSFIPSFYIKGDIPNISYFSDDIYYPGSPNPIPYWEKYENKGISVGLKSKTPLGGKMGVSYNIFKMGEYYNLYDDREYYEKTLKFNINQPINTINLSLSKIDYKRAEIELYKIAISRKKYSIESEVINNYINFWITNKMQSLSDSLSLSLSSQERELEYAYENNVIDKMEYLKSRGKLEYLIANIMKIETDRESYRYYLSKLIGSDSFEIENPKITGITGEPIPTSYFDIEELLVQKKIQQLHLNELKKKLAPEINISLSLGLNNKNDTLNYFGPLKKNSYDIGVEISTPLFSPGNYSEIASIKHKIEGLNVLLKSKKDKYIFEKQTMDRKRNNLIREIKLLKNSLEYTEEMIKSTDVKTLPYYEKYKLLNDYLSDLELYGDALKNYYILKSQFADTVEVK